MYLRAAFGRSSSRLPRKKIFRWPSFREKTAISMARDGFKRAICAALEPARAMALLERVAGQHAKDERGGRCPFARAADPREVSEQNYVMRGLASENASQWR